MAKKVTLYIEDTDIKLLVTEGKKRVEKWASLLLEPSLVSDGVILDEDRVADSIKELFELQGVTTKKVIVGLSGLNSIFRIISLPELPKALLPEAVRNEAGRVIPLPLDQVYLAYQPIPAPEGEMRLFLVAYPRNSTDALIGTLNKAGLKPQVMDLAPLALCRCVNMPRAIIANARLSYLDIVIMSDRIPQVIRSLSLPTDAVSLEDRLPVIAEELDRTIAFYNSSNPETPLDSSVPIFVCGDLAEAPDSWQSLAGKSEHPVSTLPSPLEFPPVFNPDQFLVNMGLALKGQLPQGEDAYSSIVDFNALPEIYRPPGISWVRVLTPVAIVVGIGALAWGGLSIRDIGPETDALHSQINAKEAETAILVTQIESVKSNIDQQNEAIAIQQEQITQIEAQIQPIEATESALNDTLASLEQGLDKVNYDLREIVNLWLPTSINLHNIAYVGDSVTISGLAPDEAAIFSYARALRSSGRFPTVVILSITETFKEEEGEEIRLFDFEFLLK
jgi:type IV pilus assembly protein PilM